MKRFQFFLNEAIKERKRIKNVHRSKIIIYIVAIFGWIVLYFILNNLLLLILSVILLFNVLCTVINDINNKNKIEYLINNFQINIEEIIKVFSIKDPFQNIIKFFAFKDNIERYLNEAVTALQYVNDNYKEIDFGPYQLEVDVNKTLTYYHERTEDIGNDKLYNKISKNFNQLPNELSNLFYEIGININSPTFKFNKSDNNQTQFVLFYKVFGFVSNDSNLLRGGQKNKEYKITNNITLYFDELIDKLDKEIGPTFYLYFKIIM